MGRCSEYDSAVALRICERVANGDNINIISKEDEFPAQSTIYKWLDDNEDFSEKYARARARRADSRSDRIDDYKRQCLEGSISPDITRVVVDIEKWQAGKESPKYAEKQSLDINHKGAVMQLTADVSGICGLIAKLAADGAGIEIQGDVPDRPVLPAPVRTE